LGLGIGLLAGAASGAAIGHSGGDDKPGWWSLTAGQKASLGGVTGGVLGALFGGLFGVAVGADESMDVGSVSPRKCEQVLNRLKKFARITE
jgi:hypothetical protein